MDAWREELNAIIGARHEGRIAHVLDRLRALDARHPNIADVALHRRRRVEHEDNALQMGALAGRNMAGAEEAWSHLPFFYSDLFDLGYEAVGLLDARLDTVADWSVPLREGIVYYLEDGLVRGVLLWNVWGQTDHARALIAAGERHDESTLRGRLPR